MGFEERDATETRDVETRPLQVRFERDDSLDPPVRVYKVLEVDGKAEHVQIDHAKVAAAWDGPTKTLEGWILAILDA